MLKASFQDMPRADEPLRSQSGCVAFTGVVAAKQSEKFHQLGSIGGREVAHPDASESDGDCRTTTVAGGLMDGINSCHCAQQLVDVSTTTTCMQSW
jgi:hypothetical protein